MLREPQHERKIFTDIKTPPFVLSMSKDSDGVFQQPATLLAAPIPLLLRLPAPAGKKLLNPKDDLAAGVTALTDLLAAPRFGQWQNGFDDGA